MSEELVDLEAYREQLVEMSCGSKRLDEGPGEPREARRSRPA